MVFCEINHGKLANNNNNNNSWIICFTSSLLLTEKKKYEQKLKEGREVSEKEKIRVYLDNINEKFRAKHK